ncbi:nucleoside deaminase [uncultured Marinobacter sp.]|uniref:nucleoside deaminase n=1 Tax=uncultured Marinobacter sp. TaxID=187379 RepID=UPI0025F6C653|nr:nucleoside deaminase [uncultured Marinobacter sp.]
MIYETEMKHLARCVELASMAVDNGNPPFGSVLVDETGAVRYEGHNETAGGDETQHPEFAIARWAAANMTPDERAASTVYTSGEHCPMCAAAHGWVGLGRIVYASSSEQLSAWLDELHVAPPPVATLPINQVVPGVPTEGPFPVLADAIRELHQRYALAERNKT